MKPINSMLRLVALLCFAAPAGAYTGTVSPPADVSLPASAGEPETPVARLQRAYELFEAQEYRAADAVLRGLLADHDFEDRSDSFKFGTYTLAASVALGLEDLERGWAMLAMANASPAANVEVAEATVELALEQSRPEQAIAAIKVLAARAPEKIRSLGTRTVYQINAELSRRDVPYPQRIDFLQALFDANLLLEDGRQPSGLWRDLAELQLAQGNADAAIRAARRISAPGELLALKVDRRFDQVFAALDPAQGDLGAALARETQTVRSAIEREPRSLQHIVELTYLLLEAGRYQDLLDTCDAVLSKSAAAGETPAFDDEADQLIWIHDNRARALLAMDRDDEAVSVLEAARRMDEHGGSNVSQAINLARLYAALGKPQQALEALADLGQVSLYGLMQYHSARVHALLATPDDPRARESLAYLREHRADAPDTYLDVMIRTGAVDEASAAYRARLASPDDRNSALLSAQRYAYEPIAPLSAVWISRSDEFFARPEIVAAIEAAGRIEQVPLHQLVW